MTDEDGTGDVARRIEDLVAGYVPAAVLFATVELGIFDALGEPRTVAELARQVGASEDGIGRLCRVLAVLGFVRFEGDLVAADPVARAALGSAGAASLADVVLHHRRHILPPLLSLADAVTTGLPQHAHWAFLEGGPPNEAPYEALSRHPEEYRAFVSAMDRGSVGVGRDIAERVDLADVRRLVDFGCGGGIVARELLRALPLLTVESFDLPAACEVARGRTHDELLAERHTIAAADLRQGVPARGADVVLLSAILADFPRAERCALLRHARESLRPFGRVLVSETMVDDDRRGPPKAVMFSLLLLAATRGDQLSEADLRADLAAAGFVVASVHRGGPRDLVEAIRTD